MKILEMLCEMSVVSEELTEKVVSEELLRKWSLRVYSETDKEGK